ncbi:MAG: OmpH family outer membrane protein [bacterium]
MACSDGRFREETTLMWRNRVYIVSVGLAVFLLSWGVSAPARAATKTRFTKIGIVNVQRVWENSQEGRRARAELEQEKKRMEVDLNAKRTALEDLTRQARVLRLEIEQKSAIWRTEERNRKNADLRRRRREVGRRQDELKRMVEESRRDLLERQRKMFGKVVRELRDVVHQLGQSEGYDLVIDSNIGGVLYSNKTIDLTDLVIRHYDQKKN